MELSKEDMEIKQVTNLLKNLSKVEAPKDFETTLWRRINSENYEPRFKEESWWEKFLLPQRLIPTAAATLAVFILFFVSIISVPESENPLVAQPKLRDDVKTTTIAETKKPEVKAIPHKDVNIKVQVQTNDAIAEAPSKDDNMPGQLYTSSDNVASSLNNGFTTASFSGSVNKSGYNFLQIKLDAQEKERVARLKEKIRSYFNKQNK